MYALRPVCIPALTRVNAKKASGGTPPDLYMYPFYSVQVQIKTRIGAKQNPYLAKYRHCRALPSEEF